MAKKNNQVDKVIIFTDGACSGNPGPGGWAAILVSPLGKVREMGGHEPHTTNNKMELTAALEALLSLSKVKKLSTNEIKLYTDSKYVIQGITTWVNNWKKNGWKTADGKDVSNKELWEALLDVTAKNNFRVDWLYVPGHSGYDGNDRCDEIAVAYSKGYPIELYAGERHAYPRDLNRLPPPQMLSGPSVKKPAPYYLSYVNGLVHRDLDWKTCDNRVKGTFGSLYRKVATLEDEIRILKDWGVEEPPKKT
jgi:ribonuclease HI